MSTANDRSNLSLSDLTSTRCGKTISGRDEHIRTAAELRRVRDILSMGLADAHNVSVSLLSPEMLFR
ncbi:MAG: hypothetical protein M0Z71_03980 [Nitrospiraceae bacterium]|nr:hypothetical protein [Nitrospiraceae bacterium]